MTEKNSSQGTTLDLPPLVLLQLTTTGPSLERDAVLEVSLARIEHGQLQTPWHRVILPETKSPTQLQSFHGVDLAQGINLQELQQVLDEFVQGQLVVAYGLREQQAFLKSAGLQVSASQGFCLQKAAARLDPEFSNKGLLELAERLQLMILRPFRAPDRLLLLWQLLLRWQNQLSGQLDQLLKLQFKERLVPVGLDPALLDQIPDTPGVYRMFAAPSSQENCPTPLYIGKSIHLRTRVKSHFSADQRSSKSLRMAQMIESLDWIPAAGDLGAQLKEAQQIKKLRPLMNRRLRRQKNLLAWKQSQPGAQLELVAFEASPDKNHAGLWGFFNSAHHARKRLQEKITAEGLCPACLGLEKREHGEACFAHQLGQCRGACCGQESLQTHQERLQAALRNWQFEQWPWEGGQVLEEKGAGGCEYHALNAWQYIGSSTSAEEAWTLARQQPEFFDRDCYRLLRAILQPAQEEIHWHGSILRLMYKPYASSHGEQYKVKDQA